MKLEGTIETHQRKVENAFEQIQGEPIEFPSNIDVHFYFLAHGSDKDFDSEDLREHLRSTDILVMENSGWNDEFVRGYSKVAKGDYKEYEKQKQYYGAIGDTFNLQFTRTIYNCKKPVVVADVHKDDPAWYPMHRLMQVDGDNQFDPDEPHDGNLEVSIRLSLEAVERIALAQAYREEVMIRQICSQVGNLAVSHPKLIEQDSVSAVFVVGAAHTPLFHRLRDVGDDTNDISRSFAEQPIYAGTQLVQRARVLGVELSDQQRRSAVLGGYISQVIQNGSDHIGIPEGLSSYGSEKIIYHLTKKLDEPEVEVLMSQLLKGDESGLPAFFRKLNGYLLKTVTN